MSSFQKRRFSMAYSMVNTHVFIIFQYTDGMYGSGWIAVYTVSNCLMFGCGFNNIHYCHQFEEGHPISGLVGLQIVPKCNENVRTRQTRINISNKINDVIFSPIASGGHR